VHLHARPTISDQSLTIFVSEALKTGCYTNSFDRIKLWTTGAGGREIYQHQISQANSSTFIAMNKSKKCLPKPNERPSLLSAHRNLKMARSAQSFVRGSTTKFYEWLETSVTGKLPEGPPIWICGDCHAGNLGPVANTEGKIDIQIRDFDQTVIGNPVHDLIRLALSLATAARGSDLPGVTIAKMVEQLIEGYEQEFNIEHESEPAEERPACVRVVMKQALANSWKHLANDTINDLHPDIPLGKRFWPISQIESKAIKALFKNGEVSRLAKILRSLSDDAGVSVLDAAYWVKGCSSLGNLRYAVLLDIDKEASTGKDLCLMDIKEAINAIAPRTAGMRMPRDNGERVLEGARNLSPYLGLRMHASRLLERSVFIRELLPQDLKLEIDQLKWHEAMRAARYLASVVGKAHARQMNAPTRAAWRKELQRHQSKKIEAPSWLWNSVVELVAIHEGSYLNHCRNYAMQLKSVATAT
jgi:uncharacterized protein (DUF2252 family)